MAFPVFYKRKDKTVKGEIRLYYEEEWKTDLEDSLQLLLKISSGAQVLFRTDGNRV